MIDWRPMTEWPPKRRAGGEEFLFWQPATATGRTVLSARAVVDQSPPGPRQTVRWARIDPPRSDAEVNRERLVGTLALLDGQYFLENFFWGPRQLATRQAILTALTGAKVPKSKAGFNAFREALYAAVGMNGFSGTPNQKVNEFARRAAEIAG